MRAHVLISSTFATLLVAACSGAPENTGTSQGALTGPVEVRATNSDVAPEILSQPVAPEVAGLTKIVLTIDHVEAKVDIDTQGRDHEADDDTWTTVSNGPFTVDLLSVEGTSFASLGIARLPAGDLDGIRLVLASAGPDYVATSAGATVPLVVPSGAIRVTGDLDAEACATGHVTLEFAGRHSIEIHLDGDQGVYVLRPILRVREVAVSGSCPDDETPDQPGRDKHEGD